MAEITKMTPDELFAQAMSGIKSNFGSNPEARRSELAVAEMHRRLKISAEAHKEVFVMGRENAEIV